MSQKPRKLWSKLQTLPRIYALKTVMGPNLRNRWPCKQSELPKKKERIGRMLRIVRKTETDSRSKRNQRSRKKSGSWSRQTSGLEKKLLVGGENRGKGKTRARGIVIGKISRHRRTSWVKEKDAQGKQAKKRCYPKSHLKNQASERKRNTGSLWIETYMRVSLE